MGEILSYLAIVRGNAVSVVGQLKSIANVQMGYSFRSRLEHDPDGDVAVIQMKDLDDANAVRVAGALRLVDPGLPRSHFLEPGDILFRSRGRNNHAALVPDGLGTAILAAPLLRVRSTRALPEYLCWFLNAPSTQGALASRAAGTSVPMVSLQTLAELDVPLPSLDTQRAIARAGALAHREERLAAQVARLRWRHTEQLLMAFAYEATR